MSPGIHETSVIDPSFGTGEPSARLQASPWNLRSGACSPAHLCETNSMTLIIGSNLEGPT